MHSQSNYYLIIGTFSEPKKLFNNILLKTFEKMYKKQSFEIHSEKVEHNNIIYLINEEKRSAGVIGCKKNLDSIIIPQSINQK